MPLSTEKILQIALDLAGLTEAPADTGIQVSGAHLEKILAGIDIGPAELLLARHLGCGLALAHHPTGGSTSLDFHKVIERQVGQMMSVGVPEAAARAAIAELQENRRLTANNGNYGHNPSFAKALGMPYMNVHLPCDIIGRAILDKAARSKVGPNGTVQDVIDGIASLPEYQGDPVQPVCVLGSPDNPAGAIFTATAGGTNGGAEVAKAYFTHGVDTLLYFHLAYDNLKKLRAMPEAAGKNLVLLGHMPADRVGINPLLAALEKEGAQIIRISGL
ncbi:hypothetical protein HS125_08105 [bacterium]|nr:hypothetical protein [bacterium]